MTANLVGFGASACRTLRNAFPLVSRELRAESRRTANYWLRVLAGGVLIGVFASFISTTQLSGASVGAALFYLVHRTMLFGLWIVAPLMTADCISKEKRDGTLGLLFLTPLTVVDVIAGKSAIHMLRACTLFLAVVPLLGLPLVLGGVSWPQVLVALLAEGNALVLGIAAGILASTKGGTTIQAMVRAEWYALLLALGTKVAMELIKVAVLVFHVGVAGYVSAGLLFTLFLFMSVLDVSARGLRNTWQDEAAAPEQPRWVELFSKSEFWRDAFRWDKSRILDRNPMAWLQEYSWTARLTKWGWFCLFLFADLVVMTDWGSRIYLGWLPVLTGGLALGIAFSAAGSFRRERETGLLEILLVTPIAARKVVSGRLWGMFCNYFPAVLALLIYWQGMRVLNSQAHRSGLFALLFPNPLAFGALMVVGLYLSLTRLNFFFGWFLTWLIAFVLPAFATVALGRYAGVGLTLSTFLPSIVQIMIAAGAWGLLERNLRARDFVRQTS